jgi:hypothetical protein
MTRVSPEVYRRRRIVVFGGLLLVIALIVWGLAALTSQLGGNAGKVPGPSDSPSASAGPGDVTTAADCLAGNLLVEAVTDQSRYAAGENPQMSMKVTNRGAADCKLNVGDAAQVYTVTSGSDVWWVSTHCQTGGENLVRVIGAGEVLTSGPLEWVRERSSTTTCDSASRPKAPGGGASYHVSVEIDGFKSETTKQIILN